MEKILYEGIYILVTSTKIHLLETQETLEMMQRGRIIPNEACWAHESTNTVKIASNNKAEGHFILEALRTVLLCFSFPSVKFREHSI